MQVDLKRFMDDYDVALVVMSRDRADTLKKKTDTFLRDYHLFYSGEGYDDYQYHCTERTKVPRGLRGVSVVMNYILDTLDQEIVIFVDDDLSLIYWIASSKAIRLSPEQVKLMWIDLVVHTLDQGAGAFGINDVDIRKASPLTPFIQRAMVTTVIGVVGREHRFDERNVLKCDYDLSLQKLRDVRTVHKDLRYFALAAKDKGRGGNMEFRTPGRRYEEIDRLIKWWGDDVIKTGKGKTVETLAVRVP